MFNNLFSKIIIKATLTSVMLLCISGLSMAQTTATFTTNIISGCSSLTVQFSNQSVNATSYFWDFGNGVTSVVANPVITFNTVGNFSVKLVAYGNSINDSIIKQNYIQVLAKPIVQFTAVTTTICQGGNVQFQNQSTGFDSLLWDFGDGNTSTALNPLHAYTSAGSFSVTLIGYKNGLGCNTTLVAPNYISVTPQPTINISVDTNLTCSVSKVFQFSASTPLGSSCSWNFGDGLTTTGNNAQHTYAQPGIYSITLTVNTITGCSYTYSYPNYVTVLNSPLPLISVLDSVGCHPFSNLFTTSTSGIMNIMWDFGNGATGNQPQEWVIYNQPANYNVSVTVTYQNGCVVTSNAKSITVHQTPSSSFTVNNGIGCKPLVTSFALNPTANTTYLWDFGDGYSSTLQNPTHTYTQPGVVYPQLTATSLNGCSSTFMLSSGININGMAPDFIPDKTTGCDPLKITFTNLTAGSTQWLWNFGNGDTSTAFSPQYTYQQQGTFAVQVVCTDAFGCKDSIKKTSLIHVGAGANNFISGTPINACAPFTINLSDSSNSSSWFWDFDDGNTSTQQSPTHTFTTPGTYVVSLQTQSSGSSCSQFIPNFRTYIIGGGTAAFSYHQTDCPPYIGYFTDSSQNAIAWLWHFGDGTTSTQQNPSHTYTGSGSYNVSLTITTADGCTSTATHQHAMNFSMLSGNATAQCSDTIAPHDVQFYANSQGATSWLWTFGDGDSSVLENPLHTYANTGPFTITLTVTNDSCSHTYVFPPTEFGSGGTELTGTSDTTLASTSYDGCVPLTLNFHNPFLNAVAWHWDFGDGNTSSYENPENTFEHPGIFDVMLWVTYADGSMDTLYTPGAVKVAGAEAQFSISSENTCNGVTIQLQTDTTAIQSFEWDFGDGTTSMLSNPTHTYTGTNNYVISLNVIDTLGCSSNVATSFYADYSSPIQLSNTHACAGDSVLFSVSNINYIKYTWHFGDGDSAIGISSYHTYVDSGDYTVTLVVTDDAGCETTFTFPSSVHIDKPVADFTISNPVSNCTYLYLQFTNLSTGSVLYNWSLGDGSTSTQKDISKYYYYTLLSGYYDVTLTATKNGCVSTKTVPNAFYVPSTQANFSYSRSTGCLPVTITLKDSSTDAVSWLWNFGDASTSTLQNPTHTFTNEPTQKITLTITDINGCQKVIQKDNIVFPVAGVTVSDSMGCAPYNVSFSDKSLNAATWYWNFGDGTTSALQNPQHIYTSTGVFTPIVIVSDSFGCADTLQMDSLIRVTSPTVNFSMTNTGGCAPVIANFQNLSTGTQTYLWNFGDGSVSTQENPTHIYTIPGSYAVALTATDAAGCSATHTSNTIFTVPGPMANFSFTSSGNCTPVNVTFSDSSINAATYFWSFSDGDSSQLSSPNHTFTTTGTYQITLIVQDMNGCESVFTHPDLITIYSTPEAAFELQDSVVCVNVPVTFKNLSSAATSYHWDFGDGSTSTSQHPKHPYSSAGSYTVRLLATNGSCMDSVFATNIVRVVTNPTAAFAADVTNGCAPLTVNFQNQTTHTQNVSYNWNFGSGLATWVPNPSYTFTTPGFYTISLIAMNEGVCADTVIKTNYIKANNSDPITAPKMNYVTVLNNSAIRIQWQNSIALNASSYELYRAESKNGPYKLIYIAPANNSFNPVTTYIDSTVKANTQPYWYKVRVINYCDSSFALDSSIAHATMYMQAMGDTGAVQLIWTPYEGCAFNKYTIYRSEDAINYDMIGETLNTINIYIDSAAFCSQQYYYRIEATDLCGMVHFSESNSSYATPVSILEKQTTSITRTTVEDNSYTLTEWNPPTIYPEMVTHYFLYRSATADSGAFNLVATFDPTATSYKDIDVDVQNQNYQYKIEVENICGVQGGLSDYAKTILLKGELNPMEGSTLKWSPYEGWKEGVDYYEIQQQDANGVWQTIRKVNGNVNSIEDN